MPRRIIFLRLLWLLAAAPCCGVARASDAPSFTWFPVVFYTPETHGGLGVGGVWARRSAAGPSAPDHLSFYSLLTTRQQFSLHLFPEIYRGPWKARAAIGFLDFPDDFFGLGPDVSAGDKETYTARTFVVRPALLRRVWKKWRAGAGGEVRHTRLRDFAPGGVLEAGGVLGARGGGMWGAGPRVEWDSRDSVFSPRRGVWVQGEGIYYGETHPHRSWNLDARRYHPWGAGALALQAAYSARAGNTPFYDLAVLEGVRGVLANQFRDRRSAFFQAEVRGPLTGRWGGAVFVGAGAVWGDRPLALRRSELAGGAGLRYLLNPREGISLRMDVGASRGSVRPYIRLLEAF